jgi:L-lactate dehydrogenase complex protein LldG
MFGKMLCFNGEIRMSRAEHKGDLLMTQELFPLFQEHLSAIGGESYLFTNLLQVTKMIVAHPALVEKEVVIPPDFAERSFWGAIIPMLRDQGIRVWEAGSPASVADAPVGLSSAELAVAETGSVLLAENSLEARVVSMLTLTHFVLVRANDLVPMLDEAGAYLAKFSKVGPDQRRYVSLVTGPSRTSDIERSLTIGVQGPRSLCVLVVQNAEAR